ncbi:DUF5615 family PIN-like protein [Candidatus Poribacteria bacterium]|nr:DUF5615 family PIN-like protein [Candidatus Poribacteria bacterium]
MLVDHDIEGKAILLWGVLAAEGWPELFPLRMVTFRDVGLPVDSSDRTVWRFAQANRIILLTSNRNMKDADSLEVSVHLPLVDITTNVEDATNEAFRSSHDSLNPFHWLLYSPGQNKT